eukprot:1154081-Pelagomonas_calceolata.AAC.6
MLRKVYEAHTWVTTLHAAVKWFSRPQGAPSGELAYSGGAQLCKVRATVHGAEVADVAEPVELLRHDLRAGKGHGSSDTTLCLSEEGPRPMGHNPQAQCRMRAWPGSVVDALSLKYSQALSLMHCH